jgi:hypothetical protein
MPTASQVNVIAQQIGAMTNQNPLIISGRLPGSCVKPHSFAVNFLINNLTSRGASDFSKFKIILRLLYTFQKSLSYVSRR